MTARRWTSTSSTSLGIWCWALFSVVLAIAVVTRRDLRDAIEPVPSATNA